MDDHITDLESQHIADNIDGSVIKYFGGAADTVFSPLAGPVASPEIEPVAVARTDATRWAAVAPLFPEFVISKAPSRRLLIGRAVPLRHSLARGAGRLPVAALTPGLLRTPQLAAATPWLSATVAHTVRVGVSGPGWWEAAFAGGAAAQWPRAAAAMDAIVTARIGGDFWAPPVPGTRRLVLCCIGPDQMAAALDCVFAHHPADDLVLLVSEGAAASRGRRAGCTVLTAPVDPWSAIDRAREIHLVGDHPVGLLALFAGRRITCHAPVWWNGRPVNDVAAAVLIGGTRYADPYSGRPASLEDSISLLADWRRHLDANRQIAGCVGISGWKRRRIAAFFHTGTRPPPFFRSGARAVAAASRDGGAIAVWNSRIPAGLVARAAAAGVPLLRVEDGFIRSAGLGSDFLPPCSIIADATGIYYDPRAPSDLESLLAQAVCDAALLTRAARLIERLLAGGVTKYAAGSQGMIRLPATDRLTILVPGQVADDLSVQLGAGSIRTNLALLEQVRAANPGAFVIYKPHPDVEAGHRPGAIPDRDLRRLADLVVREGAMSALIESVDELHTMTSLAGFEALLRGKTVYVYGQPFYAGWGLTTDLSPLLRRTRRRSLVELVACVLILYPKYLDPVTALPCGPEVLIDRLQRPELWRPGVLMRLRQMQGRLRRSWRSVTHAG